MEGGKSNLANNQEENKKDEESQEKDRKLKRTPRIKNKKNVLAARAAADSKSVGGSATAAGGATSSLNLAKRAIKVSKDYLEEAAAGRGKEFLARRAKRGLKTTRVGKALRRGNVAIKKTQRFAKNLADARKAGKAGKFLGKSAAKVAKRAARRAGKAALDTITQPVRAVQNTIQTTKAVIRTTAKAAQATAKAAQVAIQGLVKAVAFLVSNFVGWIILIIIIIVIITMTIFGSGKNYINSLSGGSVFVSANYNNPEHQAIVANLQQKMGSGCDPILVVYDGGQSDMAWQQDENGGFYHNLDIRLLKTIDYLTDRHRIKIDLLRDGAPDVIRENRVVGFNSTDEILENLANDEEDDWELPENWPENWDKMTGAEQTEWSLINLSPEDRTRVLRGQIVESKSALVTGQGMVITEIDRSNIVSLQNDNVDVCGNPVAPPVRVAWQKIADEVVLRPTWEELAYTAGLLEGKIDLLESYNASQDDAWSAIGNYALYVGTDTVTPVQEILSKLKRIKILIDEIESGGQLDQLYNDTQTYFGYAKDAIRDMFEDESIDDNILKHIDIPDDHSNVMYTYLIPGSSGRDGRYVEGLQALGTQEAIADLKDAIRNIYKATQVANMVNWETDIEDYQKAYEARNKIRLVIAELMQMPAITALNPPVVEDNSGEDTEETEESICSTYNFDENLVVKQIITYSAEDDIDNGRQNLDVYPNGFGHELGINPTTELEVDEVKNIGVGGIGFDIGCADGDHTYADLHFSHAPIDNGVFTKHGTTFVYILGGENLPPIDIVFYKFSDPWGEIADEFVNLINGNLELPALRPDDFLGSFSETYVKVTFQKMLYVAF
ncbi:MAG: hypothetical protein U9M89_03375 [Patescibacteria group bacterium]|nr:hypothetical protein [Patescibacteria group bacterium]